ncbi:MAG: flagellar protein FlaG [Defluviitaleaceae bacterium]|nr:flagellar protein FlaG [Defluviitaleaceae bacterium]
MNINNTQNHKSFTLTRPSIDRATTTTTTPTTPNKNNDNSSISPSRISNQPTDLHNNILDSKTVEREIQTVNDYILNFDRKIEFEIHEETNTVMISVLEASTDRVIRQMPPESKLDALVLIKDLFGIDELV